MIKRIRFPKVFFGWWTVLASGILSFWAAGYYSHGFSALFKPLASDLGFSRAVIAVPSSIGRFEGGFESPVFGWLTDRFGPKWVVIFGVSIVGLGLILMNFVNSLWAFYLVWGVMLGTGHNITSGVPIDKTIANWFVKKRGTALGIKWVLTGASAVFVLPLIAWLISTQGWRTTCIIGGLVMWAIGIPLAWFFLKQKRPEYYGLLPDGATAEEKDKNQMIEKGVKYAAEAEEVEFTLRQSMRTPAYWLLILATAAAGMPQQFIVVHSIPFLTDMGIEPVKAAMTIGMLSAIGLVARLAGGIFADRINKDSLRFLIGGAFLIQAVGFALFLVNQTIGMTYVFFAFYYFTHGITLPLNAITRGRYFGRKAFGSIQGFSQVFVTPIAIIAPIYAGWVYDTTGSYISAFMLFIAVLILGGVTIFFARPPKPPARVTDIHHIL